MIQQIGPREHIEPVCKKDNIKSNFQMYVKCGLIFRFTSMDYEHVPLLNCISAQKV